MTIDAPRQEQIGQLRLLWKEAFGDTDAFLDSFFAIAFACDRCRCVTEDSRVTAALYWFDCSCGGKKMAYLYAVATAKDRRGSGLCRALLEDTHAHLKKKGYAEYVTNAGTAAVSFKTLAAGDRIAPKVYVLDLTTGRMVGCSDESGWKVTK